MVFDALAMSFRVHLAFLSTLLCIPTNNADGSSVLATVCPTSAMASSTIESVYRSTVCRSNSSMLDCPPRLDSSTLGFAYAGFVVLLHSGRDWDRLSRVTARMSECGLAHVLVDLERRDDLRNVFSCPHGASAVVFEIESGGRRFETPAKKTTGCNSTFIRDEHPLSIFYQTCPNTIWLSGEPRSLCESASRPTRLSVHVNVPAQNSTPVSDHSEPDDRYLLTDKILRIATVGSGPFVRTNRTNETTSYNGIVFELLDRIATNLSFNYTVVEPLDGQYGLLQEDGSFTGLVGMLQRGEVDMIAADLTVAYNRSLAIAFSPNPFFFEAIGIMITEPDISQPPLWKWTSPFDYTVWLVLLAATVIVSSILYLTHTFPSVHVAWRFEQINDCFWHIGTGLLSQGLDFSPASWWGQTLLSFWWLLCLAVIAAYSGNLVAMLTTNSVMLPLNTFGDLAKLVEAGQYRVCVQNGTSFYDELMKGNSPSYEPIRKFLLTNWQYSQPTTADCVRLMAADKKLAVVQEVNQLEDYQRIWCKNKTFIILNDRFYASYFAFAFQKGSPFMSAFSVPMLEAVESGLISIWKRIYASRADVCQIVQPNASIRAAMKPLELIDFIGVILTFGIGIGLGAVLLLIEWMRKRKCFHGLSRWLHSIRPRRKQDPVKLFKVDQQETAFVRRLGDALRGVT